MKVIKEDTLDVKKKELANKNGIAIREVSCNNCKYFGYNNHKPLSSTGRSLCLNKNRSSKVNYVYSDNWCTRFELK